MLCSLPTLWVHSNNMRIIATRWKDRTNSLTSWMEIKITWYHLFKKTRRYLEIINHLVIRLISSSLKGRLYVEKLKNGAKWRSVTCCLEEGGWRGRGGWSAAAFAGEVRLQLLLSSHYVWTDVQPLFTRWKLNLCLVCGEREGGVERELNTKALYSKPLVSLKSHQKIISARLRRWSSAKTPRECAFLLMHVGPVQTFEPLFLRSLASFSNFRGPLNLNSAAPANLYACT